MTGSSLARPILVGFAALLLLAGVTAASAEGDVVTQAEDVTGELGAVEELTQAADEAGLEGEAEPGVLDHVGDAFAAVGQALAAAAQATGAALSATAAAIGSGLVATGRAIGDAVVWTASAIATGATAVWSGIAWTGVHAWLATSWAGSQIASGAVWTGSAIATSAVFLATHLAKGVSVTARATGDGSVWLAGAIGGLVADLFHATVDAWPESTRGQIIAGTGTAAGAGAAGAAAWYTKAWRYLKLAPLLAPLYSRIQPDELLEHPMRADLYEIIRDDPGVHLSELARRMEASWGTLLHHLDKLEEGGLITSTDASGKRCFFLPGQVSPEARTILPALENEKALEIATYFAAHPGANQSDAADALGYSPALISWHLKKLEEAGVVTRERVGRTQRVGVTQEAMAVVA